AGDINRTRIVMHLTQSLEPNWFLLRTPYRLVVDLPAARFAFDPEATKAAGLVTSVRYGHFDKDHSRLILGSDSPFSIDRLEVRPDSEGGGHYLTIDLVSAS